VIRNSLIEATMLLLISSSVLTGCTSKEDEPVLNKVPGDGVTYSEYFKSVDELDERENITYYEPLTTDEMLLLAPDSIQNAVNLLDSKELPFEVKEQTAFLTTSENENGNLQNQVQFSYLGENQNGSPAEFFILSVTELDENPLKKYDFTNEKVDTMGNELRKEVLTEDIPIYHQVITTNGSLVYQYYSFNDIENRVGLVVTGANEIYGYYDGHLYHVGYSIEGNSKEAQEEMLQLTRKFIMGGLTET